MKYFVKVSNSSAAKNNLQRRVLFLANRWDRTVTDTAVGLKNDLERVVADALDHNPRCKPLKVSHPFDGFKEGVEIYSYWLTQENDHGAFITVTLYRIEPEPLPMVVREEVANA